MFLLVVASTMLFSTSTHTQTASSMLAVSIGFVIPTASQRFGNNPASGVVLSRENSYHLALIYFGLSDLSSLTYVEIYNTPGQTPKKKKGSTLMGIARNGAGTAAQLAAKSTSATSSMRWTGKKSHPHSVVGAPITFTVATVSICSA